MLAGFATTIESFDVVVFQFEDGCCIFLALRPVIQLRMNEGSVGECLGVTFEVVSDVSVSYYGLYLGFVEVYGNCVACEGFVVVFGSESIVPLVPNLINLVKVKIAHRVDRRLRVEFNSVTT